MPSSGWPGLGFDAERFWRRVWKKLCRSDMVVVGGLGREL